MDSPLPTGYWLRSRDVCLGTIATTATITDAAIYYNVSLDVLADVQSDWFSVRLLTDSEARSLVPSKSGPTTTDELFPENQHNYTENIKIFSIPSTTPGQRYTKSECIGYVSPLVSTTLVPLLRLQIISVKGYLPRIADENVVPEVPLRILILSTPEKHKMAHGGLSPLNHILLKEVDPPSDVPVVFKLVKSQSYDDYDFPNLWNILSSYDQEPQGNEDPESVKEANKTLDWSRYVICDENEYIGGGSFGDVYKGKWRDIPATLGSLPTIAIKVIKAVPVNEDSNRARLKQVKREIAVWQGLRHDNILPFVGTVHVRGKMPSLISLWMENGCAKEYVKLHDNSRLSILLGIANGLKYLHHQTPEITHGDLKGDNVLVDKKGRPKLGDFGLSRIMEDQTLWQTSATSAPGTTRWKAPELLNGQDTTVTIAGDIYAYAMTSLELISDLVPFHYYGADYKVIGAVVFGDERPRMPNVEVPAPLWVLWNRCWVKTAGDRPSTEEIVEEMFKLA